MRSLRIVLFWIHLAAGVTAGLSILVMSATGALLALKPQILEAIDGKYRSAPPLDSARATSLSAVVRGTRQARPEATPTALTLQAEPGRSATATVGRDTLYLDPRDGRLVGTGSARAQAFFRTIEDWHRWLGVGADSRNTGRAINDASNLAFFLLALTGPVLWWPKRWTWPIVRGTIWFRRSRTPHARDFNWHHVIGFWCAPVIVVLTLTAVVMSYRWANNLLYRAMGSTPPPAAVAANAGGAQSRGGDQGPARARAERPREAPEPDVDLDRIWAVASGHVPTWRSITVRLAARPGAPMTFSIVDARSWNPFARSQLTIDPVAASVARWEPYEDTSLGQKARGWVRYAHTGELFGLTGQIVAGVACVGGIVLVWTGLMLLVHRLARAFRKGPTEDLSRAA